MRIFCRACAKLEEQNKVLERSLQSTRDELADLRKSYNLLFKDCSNLHDQLDEKTLRAGGVVGQVEELCSSRRHIVCKTVASRWAACVTRSSPRQHEFAEQVHIVSKVSTVRTLTCPGAIDVNAIREHLTNLQIELNFMRSDGQARSLAILNQLPVSEVIGAYPCGENVFHASCTPELVCTSSQCVKEDRVGPCASGFETSEPKEIAVDSHQITDLPMEDGGRKTAKPIISLDRIQRLLDELNFSLIDTTLASKIFSSPRVGERSKLSTWRKDANFPSVVEQGGIREASVNSIEKDQHMQPACMNMKVQAMNQPPPSDRGGLACCALTPEYEALGGKAVTESKSNARNQSIVDQEDKHNDMFSPKHGILMVDVGAFNSCGTGTANQASQRDTVTISNSTFEFSDGIVDSSGDSSTSEPTGQLKVAESDSPQRSRPITSQLGCSYCNNVAVRMKQSIRQHSLDRTIIDEALQQLQLVQSQFASLRAATDEFTPMYICRQDSDGDLSSLCYSYESKETGMEGRAAATGPIDDPIREYLPIKTLSTESYDVQKDLGMQVNVSESPTTESMSPSRCLPATSNLHGVSELARDAFTNETFASKLPDKTANDNDTVESIAQIQACENDAIELDKPSRSNCCSNTRAKGGYLNLIARQASRNVEECESSWQARSNAAPLSTSYEGSTAHPATIETWQQDSQSFVSHNPDAYTPSTNDETPTRRAHVTPSGSSHDNRSSHNVTDRGGSQRALHSGEVGVVTSKVDSSSKSVLGMLQLAIDALSNDPTLFGSAVFDSRARAQIDNILVFLQLARVSARETAMIAQRLGQWYSDGQKRFSNLKSKYMKVRAQRDVLGGIYSAPDTNLSRLVPAGRESAVNLDNDVHDQGEGSRCSADGSSRQRDCEALPMDHRDDASLTMSNVGSSFKCNAKTFHDVHFSTENLFELCKRLDGLRSSSVPALHQVLAKPIQAELDAAVESVVYRSVETRCFREGWQDRFDLSDRHCLTTPQGSNNESTGHNTPRQAPVQDGAMKNCDSLRTSVGRRGAALTKSSLQFYSSSPVQRTPNSEMKLGEQVDIAVSVVSCLISSKQSIPYVPGFAGALHKIKSAVYEIGGTRLHLSLENDAVVVRSGGGLANFVTWIAANEKSLASHARGTASGEPDTAEQQMLAAVDGPAKAESGSRDQEVPSKHLSSRAEHGKVHINRLSEGAFEAFEKDASRVALALDEERTRQSLRMHAALASRDAKVEAQSQKLQIDKLGYSKALTKTNALREELALCNERIKALVAIIKSSETAG